MQTLTQHSTPKASATHSKAPFFGPEASVPFFQPKLTVNQPGDKYEQEADAVADRVVGMSEGQTPVLQRMSVSSVGGVQRACAPCEEESAEAPKVQAKEYLPVMRMAEPEEQEVQAKEDFAIMRKFDSEEQTIQAKAATPWPAVQRMCADCEGEVQGESIEQEPDIQTKPLVQRVAAVEEEQTVQTKAIEQISPLNKSHATFVSNRQSPTIQRKPERTYGLPKPGLETRLNSSKGKGKELPEETLTEMGDAFGTDFSDVRIHTDSEAEEMNREVGAQAFAFGKDIFFNQGKFAPRQKKGKHLLAHELTHVLQQGKGLFPKLQRKTELSEEEKKELKKQLEESNQEQKDAFDPSLALAARQQAMQEALKAEQEAYVAVPEVVAKTPEPLPAEKKPAGERVAEAKRRRPDKVVPSSQKKQAESAPEAGDKPKEASAPKPEATKKPDTSDNSAPTQSSESAKPDAATGKKAPTEPGETLKYLEEQSAEICNEGAEKSQKLADNESAHDTAEEKAAQTDVAVVPPEQEGQSRSNAEQVKTLEKADKPKADFDRIKRERDQAISDAVPAKIKQLNEFKSEKRAQVIGNKVLQETAAQVGEVQGTYNKIEEAPPPAESPTPESLPSIELAPKTPTLNLGEGAVPAVPEDQTDLSGFEDEADGIYEKEGISKDMQAEFENVDSGDLAEANQEKSVLKEKVVNEPANLQAFAQESQQKVESDLQQEERKAKGSMKAKRGKELDGAKTKQKDTKTDMEKKREAVTKWINDRYKTAKDLVTEKLKNLETQALTTFDAGQKRYSQQFEDNVNSRVNAWKDDRYSGFWGPAKWVKDKWTGIDHFSAIKEIFRSERQTFVNAVNQLIIDINAANEKAIQDCKGELVIAKKEIEDYITELEPALKDVGEKAQAETNKKLDELDKHIEEEKKKLQQKLCDKKDEAIQAIDKKIEEMKASMSGIVGKLKALLLYAAKKFFRWAVEKLGGDPDKVISFIDKGITVLKKLFTDPIGFFSNLIKAVGGGISGFVTNIVSWLKKGLAEWVLGQMGSTGLQLPETFDLKGILFIGLQVAGLTWNVIRARIVQGLGDNGEKIMSAAEKGVEIVQRVVKEGPIALWDMLQENAEELKGQVMDGIRNWAITSIIEKMSKKLLMMLNPAGAIIQAITLLYDVVMFFVTNWDRIISFVTSVVNSIVSIASGAIGKASAFIESALGKTIPMILSFAARFVGLDGIAKAIQGIIKALQKPFKKILDKIIQYLIKMVKKLMRKLFGEKEEKGKSNAAGDNEVGKEIKFSAEGEGHRLWIDASSNPPKVIMASTPEPLGNIIAEWEGKVSNSTPENAKSDLNRAKQLNKQTEEEAKVTKEKIKKANLAGVTDNQAQEEAKTSDDRTEALQEELVNLLITLNSIFGEKGELPEVGKHGELKRSNSESHHVPEKGLSGQLVNFYETLGNKLKKEDGFSDLGSQLVDRGASIRSSFPLSSGNKLSAILIHKDTHRTGDNAVHGSGIMNDVKENILEAADENNDVIQIILMRADGSQMLSSIRRGHWQALIGAIYQIERKKKHNQAGKDLVKVEATSNSAVVEIHGGVTDANEIIANQASQEIEDKITNVGLTDIEMDVERENLEREFKDRINRTAQRVFDNGLSNGMAAITTSLSESEQDGDNRLHGSILSQLRNLGREVWTSSIVKSI